MQFSVAFIALGSNLGDKEKNLNQAIKEISNILNIEILKHSRVLNTKALEFTDQPDFLNQIIKISTNLEPIQLLKKLQEVELKLGRTKRFPKGPREIDLDILTFSNITIQSEILTIPHPAIRTRPFIKELLVSINEWDGIGSD
ncbi:MAG: 2-amino-4-hydroxy-6-hydroxymethyldihydropteridine diphosphokinase [Leptospiraceae bacterium]|nr:2-amino-4-hydroxy-6-hydroxymethyldihydropteridine diphosphokinase [Leptospiraceae bacterium]